MDAAGTKEPPRRVHHQRLLHPDAVLALRELIRQSIRRLDGLPAALAEVRLHRVSGIAEKRDAPVNPTGIRQDVVDVAALHILRLGALQPLDHRGAPVTEPV